MTGIPTGNTPRAGVLPAETVIHRSALPARRRTAGGIPTAACAERVRSSDGQFRPELVVASREVACALVVLPLPATLKFSTVSATATFSGTITRLSQEPVEFGLRANAG